MKKAFTLAEVLITIGIIGVVAALTIPSIITKYRENVTVNKVKKIYSILNQALLFAINENDTIDNWDISGNTGTEKLADYIRPYLKIMQDCGFKSGCIYTGRMKTLNGVEWNTNYDKDTTYYKLILADGSHIWFTTYNHDNSCQNDSSYCGLIWFDTNGKKLPNRFGYDVFTFRIYPNRITPHTDVNCSITNNSKTIGCTEYILLYSNMNYLHQ